jgi:hypothetical protein
VSAFRVFRSRLVYYTPSSYMKTATLDAKASFQGSRYGKPFPRTDFVSEIE